MLTTLSCSTWATLRRWDHPSIGWRWRKGLDCLIIPSPPRQVTKEHCLGCYLTVGAEIYRRGRYGAGNFNGIARTRQHRIVIDKRPVPSEFSRLLAELVLMNIQTTSSTPRLVHLSTVSQNSILESFGNFATTLHLLRSFTKAVLSSCRASMSQPQSHSHGSHQGALTRTSEAFADAVDEEVRAFDAWCSAREEQMCRASQGITQEQLVVSLLETQDALSDEFDTAFVVVYEIVQKVFEVTSKADDGAHVVQTRRSPSVHTTLLLDTLFLTLQEHAERNSVVVSRMLMRVFVRTAEPIWAMVGKWLRDGMNVQSGERGEKSSDLEEEFFIESSGVGIGMMSLGLFDPDFWSEGYCLRDQHVPGGMVGENWENARRRLVPSFLDHIAVPVLGTGKAIGLARVLGLSQPSQGFSKWLSFADVIHSSLNGESGEGTCSQKDRLSALFSVSVDSLSRIVYDYLWPVCEATGDWTVTIIVNDCELGRHLNAIEDLFFMRRGDTLSHFIDLVFVKVCVNPASGYEALRIERPPFRWTPISPGLISTHSIRPLRMSCGLP